MPNYCANHAQSYCRDWQSAPPDYYEIPISPPTHQKTCDAVSVNGLTEHSAGNEIKLVIPYVTEQRRWTSPEQYLPPAMLDVDDTDNGINNTRTFLLATAQDDEKRRKTPWDTTKKVLSLVFCSKITVLITIVFMIMAVVRVIADQRFDKYPPPVTYKSGAQFLTTSPTRRDALKITTPFPADKAMTVFPDTALPLSAARFAHALYKVS